LRKYAQHVHGATHVRRVPCRVAERGELEERYERVRQLREEREGRGVVAGGREEEVGVEPEAEGGEGAVQGGQVGVG
jgi:hypothetical protein